MKAQIVRHGEVLLKPDILPKEAKLIEEKNKIIVAHSETGHHHILQVKDKVENIKVYTLNGDTYINLGTIGTLFHEKSGKDVHAPHKIAPSIYKIVIKKEFDYFIGAIRQVRD